MNTYRVKFGEIAQTTSGAEVSILFACMRLFLRRDRKKKQNSEQGTNGQRQRLISKPTEAIKLHPAHWHFGFLHATA